jgi:uncharacterized protein involved in outer membrane biogenesis
MRKNKLLNRILIGFAVFFVLLIGFVAAVPYLFKPQIKAALDKAIQENIDAKVNLDLDKLSIGIFSTFPDLNVELKDLNVVNTGVFEGDTLMSLARLFVEVDVWEMISGKIRIKGFELGTPRIFLKTNADSVSNFNIVKAKPASLEDTSQSSAEFNIKIDHWAIRNGKIIFDDKLLNAYVDVENLNHSGKGDLSSTIYDITTQTSIQALSVSYGSTDYLAQRPIVFDLEAKVTMLDSGLKVELKENIFKINELGIISRGVYQMEGATQEFDLTFESTRSTFKELLSLVPKAYLSSMEGIKTEGDFNFKGSLKGKMQDQQLPGFEVQLDVDKGFFQYATLPTAISNISTNITVSALDGVLENLIFDIKKFHLDLGKNPVNGRLKSKGLSSYDLDADITAKINMAEMLQIFPMQGVDLKGMFDFNVKAKGIYDAQKQTIPQVLATMILSDGYAKTSDLPLPVENINLKAGVKNESGKMADTQITLEKGTLTAANETFEVSGLAYNLDDLTWDFKVKGALDLSTVAKLYPIQGTSMSGKVMADLITKGKTSDALAGKYDRLNTSGTCQLENFAFSSTDFPQGAKISEAQLDFSPTRLFLKKYVGSLGKSDVNLVGEITDYMAYLFKPGAVLKGNLKLSSNTFDANEWMSPSPQNTQQKPQTTQAPPAGEPMIVEVPKNLDFIFTASLNRLLYDKMTLNNCNGQIYIKNGVAGLRELSFNTLGGNFVANGTYDSRDLRKPLFDLGFKIDKLSFQESYKTFNSVKTMAPMGENIFGDFSTDFKINGILDKSMMPITETLNGVIGLKILDAAIKNSETFGQMAQKLNMETLRNPTLKDVNSILKLKDGNAVLEPFKCKINGYDAVVQGTSSLKGNIDFSIATVIPAKDFGPNGLKYQEMTGNSTIPLTIPIKGTLMAPRVEVGDIMTQLLAEAAKGAVKKQAQNLLQNEELQKKGEEALKNLFKKK